MLKTFENLDANAWVGVGLFKPSLQRDQLFIPEFCGLLVRTSKQMSDVFDWGITEWAPGVGQLFPLMKLVGCTAVSS